MQARLGPFHQAERTALDDAGHGVPYDPFPRLCGERCPVILDGKVAYTDTDHLTATFSRSFGPDLTAALQAAGKSDRKPPTN
jgi:hypothetical protein